MRVGLMVSGYRHLKTEQIAVTLASKNQYDLTVVSLPFQQRKARCPIFNHRPDQGNSIPLHELTQGLGANLVEIGSLNDFDPSAFDFLLMTGGVLLPQEFIDRAAGRVLNCHPGLIPQVRGLDAFKWAILENEEVGNTLHFINSEVDMGDILLRVPTPVFPSDTLRSFADRHYATEINILANFEQFIATPATDANLLGSLGKRHMRMPNAKEEKLAQAFEHYKQRFTLKVGPK